MTPAWLRRYDDGLQLLLHVQPGAARDEAAGLHGGRLRVRISAPPTEGRANRQLQEWLAAEFGVTKSKVELLSGAGSRRKNVFIRNPGQIPEWLRALDPEFEADTKSR